MMRCSQREGEKKRVVLGDLVGWDSLTPIILSYSCSTSEAVLQYDPV